MKQKEQKNTGKENDSEGTEESKGGLARCSVRGYGNLPEQKQAVEHISW